MFKAFAAGLLVLCAVASSLRATTAAVDHPGSLAILLGIDKVRAGLRLDSLQRALLDSLRDEYKSAARKLANPMPVTAQERAAAEVLSLPVFPSLTATELERIVEAVNGLEPQP